MCSELDMETIWPLWRLGTRKQPWTGYLHLKGLPLIAGS